MPAKKPIIGLFDLDNTLGWKTPTYPDITPVNGEFLRYFSSLDFADSIIITGRPRTQARVGLKKGGIPKEEMYSIFSGGVFEDGLFVEDSDEEIYNALNESPEEFKKLRSSFFNEHAKEFLRENGYALFPNCIIRQVNENRRISYQLLDYDENFVSEISNTPFAKKGVLYEQGNDVRATYKAPLGFMNNDLQQQKPFFEELEPRVIKLMKHYYDNPEKYATLVKWEDAVEIYPILGEETFRKGVGVYMILERIDPNKDATLLLCCDGENDISLVEYVNRNYNKNHIIIAPSNASATLKQKLEEYNQKHGKKGYILPTDCSTFGESVVQLLKELDYL